MRLTNPFTAACFISLALTLACSGGGGGDTTPPPPPAPVIASFSAAQGSITQGTSTTLTGVFSNGTGSINNGVGSVQSGAAISTGILQATTTFTLTVTGSGGTATSTATVTVVPPSPVITSFTSALASIPLGGSTTLTAVFNNGTGSVDHGVGSVQSGVAVSTGTLQATTTFLLTVTGTGGTTSSSTTVTVVAKTVADTLAYTDPVGSGFRLTRNTSLSTSTKLVLDLVGPAGTAQGVAFIISADQSKVTWSNPPSSGSLAMNLAFNPGSGTPAVVGKATGDQLQGAAFQKPGAPAVNLSQPLLRISLDLKPGVPVNTSVAMSFVGGNQLPASGGPVSLTVAVGTLVAQ